MYHDTLPESTDSSWLFTVSETDPTCLQEVHGPKGPPGHKDDPYGILQNVRIRTPARCYGYVYDIEPGPPPRCVRAPITGYVAALELAKCWKELSDYWMESESKTATRLFDEYLDMKRCVQWGTPAKILTRVSRDRVQELHQLVRRVQTPPHGYDASHVDIAPRVGARALKLYDELTTTVVNQS